MDFFAPALLSDGVDAYIYAFSYGSHKLIYWNKMAHDAFPNLEEGDLCYKIFRGRDIPCEDCPMEGLQGTGESVVSARWVQGGSRWLQTKYTDVKLDDGVHICVATGYDITAMHKSEENMKHVLNGIRAAAYTINPRTHQLCFLNRELKNMMPGIQSGDTCYKALWDNEEPCSFCPLSDLNNSPEEQKLERYNAKLQRYLSISAVKITGNSGEGLAVFTAYDITRLVESENRLRQMAYHDPLTGLRNRLAFLEDLAQCFKDGVEGCICFINVKFVKRYNLLYGRVKGNQLLRQVGSYYDSNFLESRVYRVDGAKFGLLACGPGEVRFLHKTIALAAKEMVDDWRDTSFPLVLDAAFVSFPDFAASPERTVYNAEYLLKRTSKNSRSFVTEFDEKERMLQNRRNRIEEILRTGLFGGNLQVYYQPIYDIKTGTYSKCEALLRLHDEELGWIPPPEFIRIAEEQGEIGELSKFVVSEVCVLLSQRAHKGLPPIRVNINISALEFASRDFFDSLVRTVEIWDVPPQQIQLEVTESVFMNSMEFVVEIMNELIEQGYSFALDDFGTGYSNLNYMGSMPVECLKLDKSFMDMMVESNSYLLIVKHIIQIAKVLNMSVVAEGIESRQQFEMIRDLGSDYIQGFLFSKPLPGDEFEAFLQRFDT